MDDSTRRAFLRSGASLALVGLAGCTDGAPTNGTARTTDGQPTGSDGTTATATPTIPDGLAVETTRVASGFTSPVGVEVDAEGTVFVVDQPGRVIRVDGDGTRTVLDVRSRVVDLRGYDERGLLGLALHPDFPDDGRLYLRYSAPPRPGTPTNYSHTFVLSEFEADADGSVSPDSERTLLELPEPQSNHNAGSVAFGPDGYLYVGTGDGGGANDVGTGHVDDWYARNDGGNGQDVTQNRLGSVLRIDVDGRTGDRPYGVPDDNPLVGREGYEEQYAWGFRNPWRFSFTDEAFFVADVGQNRYEEVNLVEKGGNYGWNVYEGAHCFSTSSPSSPPSDCPTETPDGERLVPPIIEYAHDGPLGGVAVIGGYYYEGDALPDLRDAYVFADWQSRGRLYVAPRRDDGPWPVSAVEMRGDVGDYVLSFGRDADGELLVATAAQGRISGSTGAVFRLG